MHRAFQKLAGVERLASRQVVAWRRHDAALYEGVEVRAARLCLQLVQHAVTRNCQGVEEPLANNRKGIEALLIGCGFKVNTKVYAKVCPALRETGKWLLKRWKHWNVPSRDGSQAKNDDTASDNRAGAVREEAA